MKIEEFSSLYFSNNCKSESIFECWDKEKRIDELLNSSIAPGIVLFDVLHGDGVLDQIKPELKKAFQDLMGDKADTYEEIRAVLLKKIELGDKSVMGMINKILGQIGENEFVKECKKLGIDAQLADSGSQKGWDIKIHHDDGTFSYVQAKMYADPDTVLDKVKHLHHNLAYEPLIDGNHHITSIDFAVPENIYDEVVKRAHESGLYVHFYSIPMSSEEGRKLAELGFGFSADASHALGNLFSELFGSVLRAASIYTLVNAFLLYKGAKNTEEFLHDTLVQTALSSTTLSVSMSVELILRNILNVGGIPSYPLILGTSIITRAMLKRIANRQNYVDWLRNQNINLNHLIEGFY